MDIHPPHGAAHFHDGERCGVMESITAGIGIMGAADPHGRSAADLAALRKQLLMVRGNLFLDAQPAADFSRLFAETVAAR